MTISASLQSAREKVKERALDKMDVLISTQKGPHQRTLVRNERTYLKKKSITCEWEKRNN